MNVKRITHCESSRERERKRKIIIDIPIRGCPAAGEMHNYSVVVDDYCNSLPALSSKVILKYYSERITSACMDLSVQQSHALAARMADSISS